jgi:hypothetical protein
MPSHRIRFTRSRASWRKPADVFLDGGNLGPPPRGKAKTNLYVSGPGAEDLKQLAGPQLQITRRQPRIADASALKMC